MQQPRGKVLFVGSSWQRRESKLDTVADVVTDPTDCDGQVELVVAMDGSPDDDFIEHHACPLLLVQTHGSITPPTIVPGEQNNGIKKLVWPILARSLGSQKFRALVEALVAFSRGRAQCLALEYEKIIILPDSGSIHGAGIDSGGRLLDRLTGIHLRILGELVLADERGVERSRLLERVWGGSDAPTNRNASPYLSHLRRHFADSSTRGRHKVIVEDSGRLFFLGSRHRWDSPRDMPTLAAQIVSASAPPVADTTGIPHRRNPEFTGRRSELARIHELLHPDLPPGAPPLPVVVSGLAGIGKTSLVVQYLYEHKESFDTVLWVDAEGEDARMAFAAHAGRLGLRLPEQIPVQEKVARVRGALEGGKNHIVIFDNVEDYRVYEDLLPRVGNARVVITSRLSWLPHTVLLELVELPEEQAVRFVVGTGAYGEKDLFVICRICQELGHLTLALALARSALRRASVTPRSLLARLQEQGPIQWAEGRPDSYLVGKSSSLIRLFSANMSFMAGESAIDRVCRAIVMVGAWFAPTSIEDEVPRSGVRIIPGGLSGLPPR